MIGIIFLLITFISTVVLLIIVFGFIFKNYKGSNIQCGGDMMINGRIIPKRKDLSVDFILVQDGRFKITYNDGSILMGDDDPAHDQFTKG